MIMTRIRYSNYHCQNVQNQVGSHRCMTRASLLHATPMGQKKKKKMKQAKEETVRSNDIVLVNTLLLLVGVAAGWHDDEGDERVDRVLCGTVWRRVFPVLSPVSSFCNDDFETRSSLGSESVEGHWPSSPVPGRSDTSAV